MATIDILRRRIEMAQAKADEYEGVILGNWNYSNSTGWSRSEGILAVTPLLDYPSGCAKIEFNHKIVRGTLNGRLYVLDANMMNVNNQVGEVTGSTMTLNATQMASARYVVMSLNAEQIDDCYIKDVTNNAYIWKGKNVT